MRQLRKTIRRILLENTQFYDKLVDMIMSLDSGNINQAIELGETMGFLELHDYEKNEREEYVRGSFSKKETAMLTTFAQTIVILTTFSIKKS